MEKPVYYISRAHRNNYKQLLEKFPGVPDKETMAACYTLAAVGAFEDDSPIKAVEKLVVPGSFDFEKILETAGINQSYRALINLAANLYDDDNYANVSKTFSPLNQEYQAVVYQALLLKFPSFSSAFESRYYGMKKNG